MMDCRTFSKYVKDYIAQDLSEEISGAMKEHMKFCEECRRNYEEQTRGLQLMEASSIDNNYNFVSSRTEILSQLNPHRYNNKFANKISFFFKRNARGYAVSFGTAILALFIGFFAIGYFKNVYNAVPASWTGASGLSKREVKSIEGTLTSFVKKYYVVTKEDVAISKDIADGFKNDEEMQKYMKLGDKYNSEMSKLLTSSAINEFMGSRSWYLRAYPNKEKDFTTEISGLTITEEVMAMDGKMAAFRVNFEIEKKEFDGTLIAHSDVSKMFYLSMESGKWKINQSNSYKIGDNEFKNFE